MIAIEDERHAEPVGKFSSVSDALVELERRAKIGWDQEPNRAPCEGWKTCGRTYEIVEYDDAQDPWKEVRRYRALETSAAGVWWLRSSQDAGD